MGIHSLSRSDPGPQGTARWRRVLELQGKTQAEIGRLCRPALDQPAINQFESAKIRLTWDRAKQLAPAYCRELLDAGHKRAAILGVWALWFRSAEVFGNEIMRREAREIQAHMGGAWAMPTEGLLTEQDRVEKIRAKVERMIAEQAAESAAV